MPHFLPLLGLGLFVGSNYPTCRNFSADFIICYFADEKFLKFNIRFLLCFINAVVDEVMNSKFAKKSY